MDDEEFADWSILNFDPPNPDLTLSITNSFLPAECSSPEISEYDNISHYSSEDFEYISSPAISTPILQSYNSSIQLDDVDSAPMSPLEIFEYSFNNETSLEQDDKGSSPCVSPLKRQTRYDYINKFASNSFLAQTDTFSRKNIEVKHNYISQVERCEEKRATVAALSESKKFIKKKHLERSNKVQKEHSDRIKIGVQFRRKC